MDDEHLKAMENLDGESGIRFVEALADERNTEQSVP